MQGVSEIGYSIGSQNWVLEICPKTFGMWGTPKGTLHLNMVQSLGVKPEQLLINHFVIVIFNNGVVINYNTTYVFSVKMVST